MIFRPVDLRDRDELAALRPKAGDTVLYEGVEYVVEQVGMRYANLHLLADPRQKGFVKIGLLSTFKIPKPEEMPDRTVPANLLKQRA